MWRNSRIHACLVSMETEAITLENTPGKFLTLSTKAEYALMFGSSVSILTEMCTYTHQKIYKMLMAALFLTVPNQKLLKRPSIGNQRMILMQSHNEILFINKNENLQPLNNVDQSRKRNPQRKSPDTKEGILQDSSYAKFKNRQTYVRR